MRQKYPRQWRAKVTPGVFDNDSGVRFQLACDEEEVVRRLKVRMPGDKEWPLSPATLDDWQLRSCGAASDFRTFDWTENFLLSKFGGRTSTSSSAVASPGCCSYSLLSKFYDLPRHRAFFLITRLRLLVDVVCQVLFKALDRPLQRFSASPAEAYLFPDVFSAPPMGSLLLEQRWTISWFLSVRTLC